MSDTDTEQAAQAAAPSRPKPAASADSAPSSPAERQFTPAKFVQYAEALLEVSPHVVVAALHELDQEVTLTVDDAKARVEKYLATAEVREGREPQS